MPRFFSFDSDSDRWNELAHREGDIVISTPMKAGTTWTQMICALLIFETPALPAPLGELSPWLDMQIKPIDEVIAQLDAQTHRRFIKTHTPLSFLDIDPRVTYIGVGRHPLDLVLSAARHSANIDFEVTLQKITETIGEEKAIQLLIERPVPSQDPEERMQFFLNEDHPAEKAFTLASLIAHYQSFLRTDAVVVRLHYRDMIDDLEREMRRLAAALAIDISEDRWPALVDAARFASMKADAGRLVPDGGVGLFKDVDAFFAVAGEGEWHNLPASLIERFEERLAELDPDGEIAQWACHGLYS